MRARITVGDDGRVTRIMPNTRSLVSKGAFCLKGMRARPEGTYHSDRLTHPMRRIGAGGGGRWERIGWDEALDEIADKMTAIRTQYGPSSLVGAVSDAAFSHGPITAMLMRSIGSPNWTINQDLCGGCRVVSHRLTGLSMTSGEDIHLGGEAKSDEHRSVQLGWRRRLGEMMSERNKTANRSNRGP